MDFIPSTVLGDLLVAMPPNLVRDPFIPQPVCAAGTSDTWINVVGQLPTVRNLTYKN